uniref:Uncharacterized protein n=1 Tax=Romanomermis culicivorax TaxID=13658 RepID=A0A915ICZ1_ROMCU
MLEFLSQPQNLQADCKHDKFNAVTDLAYMLAQNWYLQDTQKYLFLSQASMLDVYGNIMQAAKSAESSSTVMQKNMKSIHAIQNNSHPDSDSYLNHGQDQSQNQSKHPQSPTSFAKLYKWSVVGAQLSRRSIVGSQLSSAQLSGHGKKDVQLILFQFISLLRAIEKFVKEETNLLKTCNQ